jgi:hypothetical protein
MLEEIEQAWYWAAARLLVWHSRQRYTFRPCPKLTALHSHCTALLCCLPSALPAAEGKYNRYMLCAQHFHPGQNAW